MDEIIFEMNHILNYGYEIKWNYDPRSYERNFSNCLENFNGVWIRDLTMPVRRSNQLSHKATGNGRLSFVGANVPVMSESMDEMIYDKNIMIYRYTTRVSKT